MDIGVRAGSLLPHTLDLRQQILSLLRKGLSGRVVVCIKAGTRSCVSNSAQELFLLQDKSLVGSKRYIAIRQGDWIFLPQRDLENLIVFAEWKKLNLFLREVIQVQCKFCDGVHGFFLLVKVGEFDYDLYESGGTSFSSA